MSSKLCIVGGGVGGMTLATKVGRTFGSDFEVTLVDRSAGHIFKPWLHSFAAGTINIDQQRIDFNVQAANNGFKYQRGEFIGLDTANKEVLLKEVKDEKGDVLLPARSIKYDKVVLAIGSKANDRNTPGVLEHCHFIDSQEQASTFRNHFKQNLIRSIVQQKPLRIAIVGAGATGVELAAELVYAVSRTAEFGNLGLGSSSYTPRIEVSLLEGGPKILPAFSDRCQRESMTTLREIGVNVTLHARVNGAEPNGLRMGDGSLLEADMTVWAAGVKGDEVTHKTGLEVNHVNTINCNKSLTSVSNSDVFCIGDVSCVFPGAGPKEGGRPLPPTAQVAFQQSKFLAENIEDVMHDFPLPEFEFHNEGALVSLSEFNACGNAPLFKAVSKDGYIYGSVGKALHEIIYRRHLAYLLGYIKSGSFILGEKLEKAGHPIVNTL